MTTYLVVILLLGGGVLVAETTVKDLDDRYVHEEEFVACLIRRWSGIQPIQQERRQLPELCLTAVGPSR